MYTKRETKAPLSCKKFRNRKRQRALEYRRNGQVEKRFVKQGTTRIVRYGILIG